MGDNDCLQSCEGLIITSFERIAKELDFRMKDKMYQQFNEEIVTYRCTYDCPDNIEAFDLSSKFQKNY